MVNTNKLKGKIIEKGYTIPALASMLNFSTSTLYRKLEREAITIGDADAISKVLGLNYDEVMDIFFNQYVA